MYEVVWLRMLGLVFGHTVYAITTVLTSFMGGLGLGSYVFGRRAARLLDPIRTYGLLEIGIGLYCALTPGLFWLASRVYLQLHATLFSYQAYCAFLSFAVRPMGDAAGFWSRAWCEREGRSRTVGRSCVFTFGGVYRSPNVLLPRGATGPCSAAAV